MFKLNTGALILAQCYMIWSFRDILNSVDINLVGDTLVTLC